MPSSRRVLALRFAETMLLAAVGGAAFGLTGLPAGWLSGAFFVVMIGALAGRPVIVPERVSHIVFVALGILLGGGVTPDSLSAMAKWPLSLALLAAVMGIITATVTLYLRYVHGWDTLSALFASAPGALSQSMALAASTGADIRSIAVVQAVRILAFTVGLPFVLGVSVAGGGPSTPPPPPVLGNVVFEFALLLLACGLTAVLAYRWRVPGGLIVGPMIVSGILHGMGIVHVTPPPAAAIVCFVMLGAIIGARFSGADVRLLRHLAGAALGALAVGTVLAFGCAFLVAQLLSLRLSDTFLAYVPGGLEAMTILAFALKLDPAFVGTHHLARYIMLSVTMPFVAAWLQHRVKPPRDTSG